MAGFEVITEEPANTFARDLHPDLRADYIMANPPFNTKEWNDGVKDDDPRWKYGTPPSTNANFAWLQHMVHHLAPNGSLGLLLSNSSMSSNTDNEGEIRKALIEADLVECVLSLPGQLFTNTQIPACIWFLTRSKTARNGWRVRQGETLFIDARTLGHMKDRVLRDFSLGDVQKITETFHNWRRGERYENAAGFCSAADLALIRKNNHVLMPGLYVGAAAEQNDGEPFAEKITTLTLALQEQFAESRRLEEEIRRNLAGIGYAI